MRETFSGYPMSRLDDTVIQTTSILASESAEPAGTARSDPDEGYSPFPTFTRIASSLAEIDAFARAHPLKQPGAPAAA